MVTNVVITPEEEALLINIAKIKKHLRVELEYADENEVILAYFYAAVEMAENFIGGHIRQKNIKIECNTFDSPFVFEAFPVISITGVNYFEENAPDEKTLDVGYYKLTSETFKRFVLRYNNELPAIQKRDDAVSINIKVGMEKLPRPIEQAILIMVADMFERREDRVETISTASAALLRPYKKY